MSAERRTSSYLAIAFTFLSADDVATPRRTTAWTTAACQGLTQALSRCAALRMRILPKDHVR